MFEWGLLEKILTAGLGAAFSAGVGMLVWMMRLGNRVTSLETSMTLLQEAQSISHSGTLQALREIREETVGIVRELSRAREEALMHFAEHSDLQRLEDKVDGLKTAIDALARAQVEQAALNKARQGRRRSSTPETGE